MAQLGAWIAVAVTISLLLRRQPVVTVALGLALWTFLPAVAAHRVTGSLAGPLATHPSTWLVLVQLGVCLLTCPGPIVSALDRHVLLAVTTSMFIVGALVVSVLNGHSGVRLLADQIVGPAAAFLLIVAHTSVHASVAPLLRAVIIGLAVVESLLAVLQSAVGGVILYQDDFERLYWFNPERFDRWMGTTDNPLVLSLLIGVAATLAIGLRSTTVRIGSILVMSLGAIATQSRVSVVVMSCIVLYLVVFSRLHPVTRLVCVAIALVSSRAILRSELVSGISSRLSNDTGSAAAREQALEFFLGHLDSVAWVGHGLTSSYMIGSEGGLQTSLESSFMMYAVDVGLPLAVMYFVVQFALIVQHLPHNRVVGAAPAALLGALMQHTFSALGYSNMTGYLIWCTIGLAVVGSTRWRVEDEGRHAPGRRSASTSVAV